MINHLSWFRGRVLSISIVHVELSVWMIPFLLLLFLVLMVKFCEKSHLFFALFLLAHLVPFLSPPPPSLFPTSLSMILSLCRGAALSVTHLSSLIVVLHFFPRFMFSSLPTYVPTLYLPKSFILPPSSSSSCCFCLFLV